MIAPHERVRASDPDTSAAAARQLNGSTSSIVRAAIVALLSSDGPQPEFLLTANYMREREYRQWPLVPDESIRKRLAELKNAGVVQDTGIRSKSPRGRMVAVVELSETLW